MEVLSNGMKSKFWIPVEEEPDIDRFIDEQIMIDMDRFMLVGILRQVSTCKKKNEEKEYEYFKQLTVDIINICSAEDNNINIQIPGAKDEFLYVVNFRYAPEPQEEEEPELTNENDLELAYKDSEGRDIDRETEKPVEETEAIEETVEEEADRLTGDDDMTPGSMHDGVVYVNQEGEKIDGDTEVPGTAPIDELDFEATGDRMIVEDERTGEDTDITEILDKVSENIQLPDLAEGDDDETRTVSGDDYKKTEPVTELDDDGIDWGE